MMFDTTPDQAHHEQMVQVTRYVDIDFEPRAVTVKVTASKDSHFLGLYKFKKRLRKSSSSYNGPVGKG